jgi:hypothetical protein
MWWMIGLLEVLVVLVEAGFLYWLAGKKVAFKHLVAFSLVMNTFSFVCGLLLWRSSIFQWLMLFIPIGV